MSRNFPTVILVPGAYSDPEIYSNLTPYLTSTGYPVHTVALPSVGASPPCADFSADVAAIRTALDTAIAADDANRDVVLVVHSYGGVPGSEAAKGYGKRERLTKGEKGGIVHVVLISAFAAVEGENVLQARVEAPPWGTLGEDGTVSVTAQEAAYHFYNDIHVSRAKELAQRVHTHSFATFLSEQTYAVWKHVPSMYVVCTLDNTTEVEHQERMAERLVRDGADGNRIVRLRAGHFAWLGCPGEVAGLVRVATGERREDLRDEFGARVVEF